MRDLQDFRAGKPGHYPDQSVYAEFTCSRFGLAFEDNDNGTGLVFSVASPTIRRYFGGGRCSFFPQNDATAATLAADKYFTNQILDRAGIPALGGKYFFLHDRHRVHRPPGHERGDAVHYFETLNEMAFVKPLQGSRGDFAQSVKGKSSFLRYLDQVSQFYDSILVQPIFTGDEYRIFLQDDAVVYCARKHAPCVTGDGVRTIRDLASARDRSLEARGISPTAMGSTDADVSDIVLPAGEQYWIPGRRNRSAGGTMSLADPPGNAVTIARRAVAALGLRAAAVDLFTKEDGTPDATRVIEVNANPSIRLLEDCHRADLILKIWQHTFLATGLLSV